MIVTVHVVLISVGRSGVSRLDCGLSIRNRTTQQSALTFTPLDPEMCIFLWEYLETVHGLVDARCAPPLTSEQ